MNSCWNRKIVKTIIKIIKRYYFVCIMGDFNAVFSEKYMVEKWGKYGLCQINPKDGLVKHN